MNVITADVGSLGHKTRSRGSEKKKLTKILDGKSNPKNDLALNEKLKV